MQNQPADMLVRWYGLGKDLGVKPSVRPVTVITKRRKTKLISRPNLL